MVGGGSGSGSGAGGGGFKFFVSGGRHPKDDLGVLRCVQTVGTERLESWQASEFLVGSLPNMN